MTRLAAVIIALWLPGAPFTAAMCAFACSVPSGADTARPCEHDDFRFDAAQVVAAEAVCDWGLDSSPYLTESRSTPEAPVKLLSAGHAARGGVFDGRTAAAVVTGARDPGLVPRLAPLVLRL